MNRLVRMYNTTPLLAVQSQGLIISAGYINFISRDFSSIEAELAYVPRSYKLIHAHTHTHSFHWSFRRPLLGFSYSLKRKKRKNFDTDTLKNKEKRKNSSRLPNNNLFVYYSYCLAIWSFSCFILPHF